MKWTDATGTWRHVVCQAMAADFAKQGLLGLLGILGLLSILERVHMGQHIMLLLSNYLLW